jgi:hypothetical protein
MTGSKSAGVLGILLIASSGPKSGHLTNLTGFSLRHFTANENV